MLKNVGNKHMAREYSSSVVSVFVTTFTPDPKHPWNPPTTSRHRGSGSVINEKKGWILTCAHVANARTDIEVRLGNDSKTYTAKVLVQENDCDLCIIQVENPEFLQKAKQVEFGEMHAIGDNIIVVGFPFTGNELAATDGYTSNNEISEYMQGDAMNLRTLVTASINPGNSGGPVFDNLGNQIGVAFQGLDPSDYEGANEMIPMPVINQFLKSAYHAIQTGTAPKGVPALPIDCDVMINRALRQKYKMKDYHTGVRVFGIDHLANVGGLKINDIILEIDKNPIQNDGTINTYPDICERLHYNFLIYIKQMGESIDMKILRDGNEMNITVPLLYRARELKLIARRDYPRQETFYIKNGIAFKPVSCEDVMPEDDDLERTVYDLEYETINDIPKTKPGQELVSIHHIFNAELTTGYDELNGEDIGTVHTINGKPINNLKELIMVMESLSGDYVQIEIKNQETIALRVAKPEEELAILQAHKINKPYSDDLETFILGLRNKPIATSSATSSTIQKSGKAKYNIVEPTSTSSVIPKATPQGIKYV